MDHEKKQYARIQDALTQKDLEEKLKEMGVKRAKVIEKPRHLEVRAEEGDIKAIKDLLSGYSIQFDFEVKKIKPWEARFKKVMFIKKWTF